MVGGDGLRVALLRAVNVGGRKLAMAELREVAEALGFSDVRTLLQTGNLIFRADGRSDAELERALEEALAERLGLRTDFMVRDAAEFAQLVARNPYPEAAERDPSHLVVMFLKDAPNAAQLAALRAAIKGDETAETVGRQAYIVYPGGIGPSKLTITVIERALGTRGTGRNWNTVLKLADLLSA